MNIIENVKRIIKEYEERRFGNSEARSEAINFLLNNGELIDKFDSYYGEDWIQYDNKILKYADKSTTLFLNIRRVTSVNEVETEEYDFFEVIPKNRFLNKPDYERVTFSR